MLHRVSNQIKVHFFRGCLCSVVIFSVADLVILSIILVNNVRDAAQIYQNSGAGKCEIFCTLAATNFRHGDKLKDTARAIS